MKEMLLRGWKVVEKVNLRKSLPTIVVSSLVLGFAMTGTVDAATPSKPWKFDSNIISYYNDGSNSFYTGIWNTAAGRWNGTGSVLMNTGTSRDFRAGNQSASSEDWDGICYTTYSNGLATKTRAWVNTYYTTQARYTTAIIEGIATHEFGHALGLEHNDSEASVMKSYTFSSTGSLARTSDSPTSADKTTIKSKYGLIIAKSMQDPSTPVVAIDTSWAYGYESLKSLADTVDLVVEGNVIKENGVKKNAKDAYETYRTESVFKIENVLKGDTSLENSEISIEQMGGSDQDAIVIASDTTLLEEGQNAVLFLKKNSDGSYRAMNEDASVFLEVTDQSMQKGIIGGKVYQNQKNKSIINKEGLENEIK